MRSPLWAGARTALGVVATRRLSVEVDGVALDCDRLARDLDGAVRREFELGTLQGDLPALFQGELARAARQLELEPDVHDFDQADTLDAGPAHRRIHRSADAERE